MTDILYQVTRRESPTSQAVPGAQLSITPGASPYSYTASDDGTMFVSGGVVSDIAIERRGSSSDLGLTSGGFPLRKGDKITVTYSSSPSMFWFPG